MADPSKSSPGTEVAEPEVQKRSRPRYEPLWYVILHDDQLHTYDYVIEMLMKIFQMSALDALQHAVEVDSRGVTIVARKPREEAELRHNQIMTFGGDPRMKTTVSMKASIEPADD